MKGKGNKHRHVGSDAAAGPLRHKMIRAADSDAAPAAPAAETATANAGAQAKQRKPLSMSEEAKHAEAFINVRRMRCAACAAACVRAEGGSHRTRATVVHVLANGAPPH